MHFTIIHKILLSFLITVCLTSCISYTKEDFIKNYNKKEHEILGLKKYFSTIVPADKKVEIEFENDNRLFRFGVYPIDPKTEWINYPIFLEWNLDVHSKKVDSVLTSMNWNAETLKRIKESSMQQTVFKLRVANRPKLAINEVEWECLFIMYSIILCQTV